MLDHITGAVHSVGEDSAVLSVGGAGVRVEMPTRDLAQLDGFATVYTVLLIKDEQVHLYGFTAERTRWLFDLLTSVQGVGPKNALAMLSFHGTEGLERAIAKEDTGAIELVPGIGKKTAAKIVIDLKDKVGVVAEATSAPAGSAIGEVREGLKALGYSANEIQDVLTSLPEDGDAPTLLRHALRALGAEKVGT